MFHSYEPYTGREGSVYRVLVTDVSHDGRFLVGHNDCYEQVLVPKDDDLMGKLVTVRVTETSKFSMVGKLVSDATSPTSFKPLIKGQVIHCYSSLSIDCFSIIGGTDSISRPPRPLLSINPYEFQTGLNVWRG